ncbi:9495_t:CDS:2, partial [Acaulospora colombiana]
GGSWTAFPRHATRPASNKKDEVFGHCESLWRSEDSGENASRSKSPIRGVTVRRDDRARIMPSRETLPIALSPCINSDVAAPILTVVVGGGGL